MGGLARTVRLAIGLSMIAAGTSLAAPAGLQLAAWWQAHGVPLVARPDGPTPVPVQGDVLGGPVLPPPPAQDHGAAEVWPVDQPPPPRPFYAPPPPTPPLPPPPSGLSVPGPGLAAQYRTTLAVPPPPLLDGQRPPPVALGWAARGEDPAAAIGLRPDAVPPATYKVRDGDDLTAIAIRFYGNPAAASAIWQANRGIIPDPGLLPIGATLVLPHPESLGAAAGGRPRRSIEPAAGSVPARPVAAPAGPAWLDRG